LDPASQAKWEERLEDPAFVNLIRTWESMASFLEQRCRTLETMDFAMANYAGNSPSFFSQEGAQLQEALPFAAPSALPSTSTALIAQEFSNYTVLLATASVLVKNRSGFSFPVELYSIRAPNCI